MKEWLMKIALTTLVAALLLIPACGMKDRLRTLLKRVDVHMGVDYIEEDEKGNPVSVPLWEVRDIEEKIIYLDNNPVQTVVHEEHVDMVLTSN